MRILAKSINNVQQNLGRGLGMSSLKKRNILRREHKIFQTASIKDKPRTAPRLMRRESCAQQSHFKSMKKTIIVELW